MWRWLKRVVGQPLPKQALDREPSADLRRGASWSRRVDSQHASRKGRSFEEVKTAAPCSSTGTAASSLVVVVAL